MNGSPHTELAQIRHAWRLLALPGVVWVGVGIKQTGGRSTGESAVVVGVVRKRPIADLAAAEIIPARLRPSRWSLRRSVRTDVVQAGEIKALNIYHLEDL